jgi:DNA-binding CsgD family transcriptional regulator
MYEDEDYLVQCLEVGAAGYVLKDTPAPQLLTAVRDVYKGGKYLSSQVLGKLVEDFRSRVRDTRLRPRISTLTPREREILKLLAEGNSVKEIAVILGLSVKTVEAHKFNLMRKLDIHNKAQLVTYAIQKKIIKIPVNQWSPPPPRKSTSLASARLFCSTNVCRILQLCLSCCIITSAYVGIPRKDDSLVSAGRNVVCRDPGDFCGKGCAHSCHGVMS